MHAVASIQMHLLCAQKKKDLEPQSRLQGSFPNARPLAGACDIPQDPKWSLQSLITDPSEPRVHQYLLLWSVGKSVNWETQMKMSGKRAAVSPAVQPTEG